MKEIVKCSCGREEYYGMMHWINGKQVCRECAFENWEARRQRLCLPIVSRWQRLPYTRILRVTGTRVVC